MAVRTHDGGAADGLLDSAANWSGDVVPADTESFGWISDGDAATPLTGNMAAFAAYNSDEVFVEQGYTKAVGADGNQFDLNTWNQFLHRGSGKVWLLAGGGVSEQVTVISSHSDPKQEVMSLDGATTTTLSVVRGLVTVAAGATVDNVSVGSGENPQRGANVAITNGANINMGYMQGGLCTCNADIDEDLIINGGEWTQQSNTIAGTVLVFGGIFNFDFAGTIPLVIQYGGTIDVTRQGGQKTFTNFVRFGGTCIGLGSPILAGKIWDYTA